MNAINDMIIEGIICKDCGNFIDGEAPGYERSCGCIDKNIDIKEKSFTNKIKDLFK